MFGGVEVVSLCYQANEEYREREFFTDVETREGINLAAWRALGHLDSAPTTPSTAWICTEAYTATIDGKSVEVPAGARVGADDPLVIRDPSKWVHG